VTFALAATATGPSRSARTSGVGVSTSSPEWPRSRNLWAADGAAATLERAIALDPYAESLYRLLIEVYGRLGRHDAARRTFTQLERRLEEIDVDPDPETTAALKRALEGASRRLRSVPDR
jgi:DNA-binding SARP family transcriptional activator